MKLKVTYPTPASVEPEFPFLWGADGGRVYLCSAPCRSILVKGGYGFRSAGYTDTSDWSFCQDNQITRDEAKALGLDGLLPPVKDAPAKVSLLDAKKPCLFVNPHYPNDLFIAGRNGYSTWDIGGTQCTEVDDWIDGCEVLPAGTKIEIEV